jgi:HAD superfamily hydrolase (TIGR01490 family)
VSLAIFDLDNTLLAGDSDYLWGRFLVDRGIVDRFHYEAANARFYEEYQQGILNIEEFLEFALKPLADHETSQLNQWRAEFIAESILPIVTPVAKSLVNSHRSAGDTLLIITATNLFVTEPIAELFDIDHLLATIPEMADGRYTGRFSGTPCFREGKVHRLDDWLAAQGESMAGSWFYSDSQNDLPLLSRVSHPVAVDPDPALADHARDKGWPIISLRDMGLPETLLTDIAGR